MSIFAINTPPLGLNISDTAIKIVQLKKERHGIRLQAVARLPLSKGTVENGEIIDPDLVSKKINEALAKPRFGRFTTRRVVANLPETKTFLKLINIEKGPNPISSIIEPEVQKYIPYALNEIFYDYQKIGEFNDQDAVLIGACPQKTVNQISSLFSLSRLELEALEPEAISLSRCLLEEESPQKPDSQANYGILDIGAKRANMIFYSMNTVLFNISMPISSQEITKQIAKTLDIDYEQAEKAKIICGLDETKAQGVVKKILEDMIGNLLRHIKEAFAYLSAHYPDRSPVTSLILTGGGANIKNLDQILKANLGQETRIGNPLLHLKNINEDEKRAFWEKHEIDEKSSDQKNSQPAAAFVQDNSSAYNTAVGLALRGIFDDKL